MGFNTIQNSDYSNRLIANLPTRPNASPGNFGGGGLTAVQMKQAYDAMPLFIIGRLNALIEYINGTGDERLSDAILASLKNVIADNIPTGISDEIKTLKDLFDSVKNGNLAKALFVPSGQKSLNEMIGVLNDYEAKFNDYDTKYSNFESVSTSLLGFEPRLSRVEKQVENFYKGGALPIAIDDSVAYSKTVPNGALPYAEVAKVGGMSHKSDNLLPEATIKRGYWEISGDTVGVVGYDVKIYAERFAVKPNTVYSVSTTNSSLRWAVWCVDENYKSLYRTDGWIGGNGTFTTPNANCYALFCGDYSGSYQNDIMINEGSTALPYSPYFEGLRHAKVTAVKSIGANLLDFDTWAKNTDVNGGVKVVGDNEITITATNSDDCYTGHSTAFESNKIYVEPNKVYSLCWEYAGTSTGLVFVFLNGTDTIPSYMNAGHITFTTPENCDFVTFRFGVDGIGNSMTYRNIGFYEGEARKFAPYVGTLATIPIPTTVQSLPDYGLGVSAAVNNHIDWSERKYYHPCRCVVLDGSADEGWGIASDGLGGYYIALSENGAGSNVLSNRYESAPYPWAELGTIGVTAQGVLWVTTETTSVEDWRSSLESNPLEIVYELATPEVTDISHLIPEDNFILVEAGGQIVAENEHGLAAPTEIIYQLTN